jgi:hypothetical protein
MLKWKHQTPGPGVMLHNRNHIPPVLRIEMPSVNHYVTKNLGTLEQHVNCTYPTQSTFLSILRVASHSSLSKIEVAQSTEVTCRRPLVSQSIFKGTVHCSSLERARLTEPLKSVTYVPVLMSILCINSHQERPSAICETCSARLEDSKGQY